MAIDMLLGKSEVGESVVVRGGGLVASDIALYLAQKGKKPNVHTVGDCKEPRLVVNAVWEAARVARGIFKL